MKRLGLLLLIWLLAACGAIESEIIVRPDEIGVLVDTDDTPRLRLLPPGRYTFDLSQRIFLYPTFTQIYQFSPTSPDVSGGALATGAPLLQAVTADNVTLQLGLDVVFHINPEAVLLIHEEWASVPGDYRAGYIYNTVRIVTRSVISTYTAAQLYQMPPDEVQRAITSPLQAEFAENGFTLDRVTSLLLQFPEDVLAELQAAATPIGN